MRVILTRMMLLKEGVVGILDVIRDREPVRSLLIILWSEIVILFFTGHLQDELLHLDREGPLAPFVVRDRVLKKLALRSEKRKVLAEHYLNCSRCQKRSIELNTMGQEIVDMFMKMSQQRHLHKMSRGEEEKYKI